jgi:hypothetical protein
VTRREHRFFQRVRVTVAQEVRLEPVAPQRRRVAFRLTAHVAGDEAAIGVREVDADERVEALGLGGIVAANWGWRVAFFALGIPGLLAAVVTLLTLREPPRGLADGVFTNEPAPSMRDVFVALWSKPAFRHLLIGFTIAGFAMNAVAAFVLPFYLRGFAELSLAKAGRAERWRSPQLTAC